MENKEIIPYHKPYPLLDYDIYEITTKIEEVLESGQLTNGKYVLELEEQIKELYGVDYVIATSNCTMGLMLCFQYKSWLDTVHMPNFTWMSPYLTIPQQQKKFYDIDPKTWLMKEWPRDRRELIFPTHTFGNILQLERDYNVFYDGAHALGSEIKYFGEATVLSLAPTKLITSCEGGLVLTDEKYLADFVRFRRDKCTRMSEVHAIIGLKTLEYLEDILRWKRKVYRYYKRHIPGGFQEIPHNSNYNTIGFLNTEKLEIPDHISTKQYYQPVYQIDSLPNAYDVFMNIVCLPSYYGCPFVYIVEEILELNDL